ncbi:prostaglandin E2 receptor EP2 subtype-like [Osmerus eperlanus]|uniref:prostaglandin E2 receptor EP2 subtype-like n=1 Tax=Osmerus eperlanus TaxID=29151 RepID=UPI002E148588
MGPDDRICNHSLAVTQHVLSGNPTTSAVMFATGVIGNLSALVFLAMRCNKQRLSLFYVLVTALLMKDLLGTLAVSPLVLTSYATNTTLTGMKNGKELCKYFGFSMTFLSLATLATVCAMAQERYLAIGHPYFHERHLNNRCGYITIPVIYLGCIIFCVTPFVGFGSYVQYCPGTWCFLDMNPKDLRGKVYAGLYATFTLVMISGTVLCNVSVICHLVKMRQRRRARAQGSRQKSYQRSLSLTEEVEHLLLLSFITVVFCICSFPLVLRVYFNLTTRAEEKHYTDLAALRMLSFNSIIDPWVFIIFNPSVMRFFWRKLRRPRTPQVSTIKARPIQPKLVDSSFSTMETTSMNMDRCHDP